MENNEEQKLADLIMDGPKAVTRSRLSPHYRTFKVWPLLSTMNIVTSTFLATLLPPFSNSPLSMVMYKSFLISPSGRGKLKPVYIYSDVQ